MIIHLFIQERSRTRRKQRIDLVLKAAALAGDSLDWNDVPGVWVPKNKLEPDDFSGPCPQSPSDRTFSEMAASTMSDDEDTEMMDNENVTQYQFENLHVRPVCLGSILVIDFTVFIIF